MKVRYLMGALGVASLVWMGTIGSARAADKWFVLGQQAIKSANTGTEIKGEEGKLFKEDVKKAKISAEGADVEITQIIYHWNMRPDDTLNNVGVLKAGGETAPQDAPGHEATLTSVTVQYKILNNAQSATLKVWGFD